MPSPSAGARGLAPLLLLPLLLLDPAAAVGGPRHHGVSQALAGLAELVPPRPGVRFLARWGSPGARCQRALQRGARRFLGERLRELREGRRATGAGRRLARVVRRCDGVRARWLPAVGGRCAELVRRGQRVPGDRLRACLSASLERIAQRAAGRALRPNIVLILTDDQRWDTLAVMPHTRELLAERGVRFANGFATTSLCCPDRASILTGEYAHDHGVFTNAGARDFDDSDTLPLWLQAGGYRTALLGKYMNGTGEVLGTRVPPGWDEWQVFTRSTGLYLDYQLNENGTLVDYGSDPADYSTDLLARRTVETIESTAGEPFFLMLAPFAPHIDAVPAARHVGFFTGTPPWRPPSWREEDLSTKPAWVRFQRFLFGAPEQIAVVDETRIAQLETLLAVDEAVASISAALDRLGLTDNTVVVFTSDNGFLWNEHWLPRKNYPYEESIRVPFLVRYPLASPAARRSDELVLHLDLAATFTELAGVATPPRVDGESLVPLVEGRSVPWRSDFLAEHQWDTIFFAPTNAVRTRRWKYIETEPDLGGGVFYELYDLENDPYELENRAEDPDLAGLREELAERLRELMGE
ncbi:MAG: sulfatase [Myxococcota bacterium]|nr:sulfatase [Myxococcota bacterium]